MAVTEAPGFRGVITLDDIAPSRGPGAFDLQFETAETRQRAKSGRLLTHRLFGYDGAPDRIRKAKIRISYPSLTGVDIALVNDLIAWGGPISFSPWVWISESFPVLNGVASSGTLSRLDAWTQNGNAGPSGTAGDFEPKGGYTLGARDQTITIGTPDTTNNRTPWTGPTPGADGRLWIAYAPLFIVMVGEDQPSFPQAGQQGHVLTLEEV